MSVFKEWLGFGKGYQPSVFDSPHEAPAKPAVNLEILIREGAALKDEIDGKAARLRVINQTLAESARFENGKETATLFGAGYKVKVSQRESVSWDQERILKFREYINEGKFEELFKVVYEPTSKKTIDGFIAHADKELSNGLKWCMSVKPATPQVSYEKLEEGK